MAWRCTVAHTAGTRAAPRGPSILGTQHGDRDLGRIGIWGNAVLKLHVVSVANFRTAARPVARLSNNVFGSKRRDFVGAEAELG
jgi:hypothetical protein